MKQVFVQTGEFNSSLKYEYDIFEDDFTKTSLHTSNSSDWAKDVRETQVATMINHGDGLHIKLKGLNTIKVDYAQALELLVLLSTQNDARIEIRESSLFKVIL